MTRNKHATHEEVVRNNDSGFHDWRRGADLEHRTKLHLARTINRVVTNRSLTQSEAAALLKVNQPKISALIHYKLDGFSVERLMHFLTALDLDIEIVVKEKPRSRTIAQISVISI